MNTIRFFRCSFIFLLVFFFIGQPYYVAANGNTRYVSATGADSGDCTLNPCATIAYAISKAVDGDTIDIAAGTYTEAGILVGNQDITITKLQV